MLASALVWFGGLFLVFLLQQKLYPQISQILLSTHAGWLTECTEHCEQVHQQHNLGTV